VFLEVASSLVVACRRDWKATTVVLLEGRRTMTAVVSLSPFEKQREGERERERERERVNRRLPL